jgi:hypothetical protein
MARDIERNSQAAFDVSAYMPNNPLPPLVAPQNPTESAPVQPQPTDVREAYTPPVSSPRPYVPASTDALQAWHAQRLEEQALRQPPVRPSMYGAPSGLFVPPALMPRQERPALPAAPEHPALPAAPSKRTQSGRTEKDKTAPPSTEDQNEQSPPHLIERAKKHKKATAVIAVGLLSLSGYGVTQAHEGFPNMSASASAQEAQYPSVRNEAINCDSKAFTMAFTVDKAKAQIPVTLKEAGHTDSYLEFEISGLATAVTNICGIRKNTAGQTLASFNKKTDAYTFDRSKIQLSTTEALFNTTGLGMKFTGEYVDGKALTAAEVKKYPFDDATNKKMVDLLEVKQDAKTKANVLTAQPRLLRLIRIKMEMLGLQALQDPDTCANTQDVADQTVGKYIKGQIARKTLATSKALQAPIIGDAKYGDLTSAFIADPETKAVNDSTMVKIDELKLKTCDAWVTQATPSQTSTSKKG